MTIQPESEAKNFTVGSVKTIFSQVQFGYNDGFIRILTDIYNESNFEDFLNDFIQCLKVCLMHEEKSPNVEKTLDFAAKFVVSFISEEDEACPLLEGIFQFIFENHECNIQLVRLRICQLMNRLLDNMGHDATVLEDTYRKIAENMLLRLQDTMSSVRTQAVYALHRLQSPNDPTCEITKAFLYHMTHDPCHEVRRAIIQKIAVNKMTLASILTRMNDVKETVRKEAYVIISRFLIRQFTKKQRQLILECGLGDRSEMCRDYVTGVLVPNWLKYFNHNYYDFLECIQVEKIPETGIKLLKIMFAKLDAPILESRVKQMWITNKRIPYEKLNIISVVYWRALAEFLKSNDNNDNFEHIFQQVLPDLTPFCQYIREYFFPQEIAVAREGNLSDGQPAGVQEVAVAREGNLSDGQPAGVQEVAVAREGNLSDGQPAGVQEVAVAREGTLSDDQPAGINVEVIKVDANNVTKKEPHVVSEAVLVHLLEMCKVYDLADEMGRMNVKQMCIDFLQSPAVTGESIPVLAALLDHVIPSVATKLSVMAEIITELREPLQADNNVYVPDLLLIEAEMKKHELGEKIYELDTQMEIAKDIGDKLAVEEIKFIKKNLEEELAIMNSVTPLEPGRNVKNDPATLSKCLTIVLQIIKSGKVQKMNATLYSLMQNFIIPTLALELEGEGTHSIKNQALQALGIFCVLDPGLAKEHFMAFCFNIANDILSVTALKCVFDLLHIHGLAIFNIENPFEGEAANESIEYKSRKPNLILLLVSLLDSKSAEMRKTAVIGLCRLLLAGRLKSPDLITKLIKLWYNPAVENDPYVRQPLGVFFQVFAANCSHAQNLLLKAFVPTLTEFFKLEVTDPLAEIDVENVANLLVELTRPGINSKQRTDVIIHNLLAINICEAMLKDEFESANRALFFKVINHLELNFQKTTDINILTALASRLVKSLPKEDKLSCRLAVKFETMLKVRQEEKQRMISIVCNTLSPNRTYSSFKSRGSTLLCASKDDSESSGQEEDEELSVCEEEDSKSVGASVGKMIISSSSESSDSDSGETSEDSRPPLVKTAKMSPEFKHPGTPPLRTPSRKMTRKTPARNAPSPSSGSTSTSSSETSSRTSQRISGSTRSSGRTPAKQKLQGDKTPKREYPEDVSERVTRSGRKRRC